MLPAEPNQRDRDDRCPGVLKLVEAADGWLARVRLPGGLVTSAALVALASVAAELGHGKLELTSRGNVQLRGLAVDAATELGARLSAAGLWPSETHERVRNIIASPLAGLDRPVELESLVHELDRLLCAEVRMAELSGRFLFALDDGRGDVSGHKADVLAVVGVDDAWVEGVSVRPVEVPALMLRCAAAFLDERQAQQSSAWRVDDLVDGRARMRTRVSGRANPAPTPATLADPIGPVPQLDGRVALVVLPRLGRLTDEQALWVATQLTDRPARITPARTIVIPDLDPSNLASVRAAGSRLGLEHQGGSPWFGVSACAGKPACAKAFADVQHDAAAAIERWPGRRVHWSGCARQCGRPASTEIDLVATATGYTLEHADGSRAGA